MELTLKRAKQPLVGLAGFLIFFALLGSALAQTTPTWTLLGPTGGPPPARQGHSAVLDEANNRMIVFGGTAAGQFNDVWVLANADGLGGTPAWTQLAPSGTLPAARYAHTAVYDPATNRMIVFGGIIGPAACGCVNDVWMLSNANGLGGTPAWTQLAPTGGPPSARRLHGAVYDEATNRMTVFGGQIGPAGNNDVNDVWVLSNANGLVGTPAWTQLAPTGGPPSPRYAFATVYDAGANRMTLFGGIDNTNLVLNEVWVLSSANGLAGTPEWTQLAPSGTPPGARFGHSAVLDPTSNRIIVFAGQCAGPCTDVWVLSKANGLGGTPSWTQLAPSLDFHATAYR